MDYGFHNSRSSDTQASLEAAAKKQMEENQEALASTFEAKDGKLFGFIPIPPEMERSVNFILGPATQWISEAGSKVVYGRVKQLAEGKFAKKHLPEIHANPAKAAMFAELGTMWGVLALRPVAEFVAAQKNYAYNRYEFSKNVKGVCEATGADYYHNDVVKVAMKSLNDGWMSDMKKLIPGLLVFGSQVPYGIKNADSIYNMRESEIARNKEIEAVAKAKPNKSAQEIAKEIALKKRTQALDERSKASKEFFKKFPDLNEKTSAGQEAFNNYLKEIQVDGEGAAHADDAKAKKTGDLLVNQFSVPALAGMFGKDLQRVFEKKDAEKEKQHNSYQLIQMLAEEMQGRQSHGDVHQAVVDIFQQLEEDMGRSKFKGGLLNKLEDSTKQIAEMITQGRLDPLALVKLAGENKVIKHASHGKRTFLSEKEIAASVQELLGSKVDAKGDITAADFIATFANPMLAKETIAKNINDMKGDERDFFIATMPTEILEQAGLKKAEISERRRAAHCKLYDEIGAGIIHMAALKPELLKNYGVSEEDIGRIQQLSQEIQDGNIEQLKASVDSRDSVVTAVAQVALSEQIKGEKSWTERVGESKTLSKELKEKQAEEPQGEGEEKTYHTGMKPLREDLRSKHKEMRGYTDYSPDNEGITR